MALHSPDIFNDSPPAGHDGVFEWDFMDQCWPRGIKPCDVDAQIEIRGHFLKFETKRSDDPLEVAQRGQRMTVVRAMERMGPYLTYLLIQGKTASTIRKVTAVRYDCGKWTVIAASGKDALIALCASWSEAADRGHILCMRPFLESGVWSQLELPLGWRAASLYKPNP